MFVTGGVGNGASADQRKRNDARHALKGAERAFEVQSVQHNGWHVAHPYHHHKDPECNDGITQTPHRGERQRGKAEQWVGCNTRFDQEAAEAGGNFG